MDLSSENQSALISSEITHMIARRGISYDATQQSPLIQNHLKTFFVTQMKPFSGILRHTHRHDLRRDFQCAYKK